MKVNKFILAGVAVLGLGMTACNNDDVPSVGFPTEGTSSLLQDGMPKPRIATPAKRNFFPFIT